MALVWAVGALATLLGIIVDAPQGIQIIIDSGPALFSHPDFWWVLVMTLVTLGGVFLIWRSVPSDEALKEGHVELTLVEWVQDIIEAWNDDITPAELRGCIKAILDMAKSALPSGSYVQLRKIINDTKYDPKMRIYRAHVYLQGKAMRYLHREETSLQRELEGLRRVRKESAFTLRLDDSQTASEDPGKPKSSSG